MLRINNFDSYLIAYTKINSEWIIDFNVKHKTLKRLEDIGDNLRDIGLIIGSLATTLQQHDSEKKKNDRLDFIKLKN